MMKKIVHDYKVSCLLIGLLLLVLVACKSETPAPDEVADMPTQIPTVALLTEPEVAPVDPTREAPATWTPQPTLPPPATSTPLPTVTVAPTDTPAPIPTNTPLPTDTPVPTATPIPPTNTPAPVQPTSPPVATVPENPILGANLLSNPSFENGWYNQNGIPELQLPNDWQFDWDEGPTGFGGESWDVYVRPETRVLPSSQLPPAEQPLFIYDGSYTIKMFKGSGAISFRLWTDVTLEPGTYIFEVSLFPDLVMGYTEDGQKIWADDPRSGEIRLFAGDRSTDWLLLNFGQKNVRNYTFTVDQTQTMRVGMWTRGRYAIANNGFFFDDWSLKRVEN